MKILLADPDAGCLVRLRQLLALYFSPMPPDLRETEDGARVLPLAKSWRPDLLLLNAGLTLSNGTPVMCELRQQYPEIRLIVLTDERDFDAACLAIRCGALDLLLQPVDEHRLNNALDRAVSSLDCTSADRRRRENAQKLTTMLQREFMHKVMVNFRLKESIIEEYARMIGVYHCWYRVLLAQLPEEYASETQGGSLLLHELDNNQIPHMYTYFAHTICVIAYADCAEDLADPIDAVMEGYAEHFPGVLYQTSEVAKTWEKVAVIFYDTLTQLNHRKDTEHDDSFSLELEEQLSEAVISRDEAQLSRLCRLLVRDAYLTYGTANDFGYYLINVYRTLLRSIYATDEESIAPLQKEVPTRFLVPYRGDEEQAYQDLYNAVCCLTDRLSQNLEGKNLRMIRQVQRYIDQHYDRDLSLDELALHASISKYYLSRTFKAIVGENLRDYLQKVRIEHAKQFLLSGDNVASAAYRAGFSDPAYFGKCFKRLVGIPPAAFQKNDAAPCE